MLCNECIKIIEDLEEKLADLKSETDHILIYSEKAVLSCKSALLEMQNLVLRDCFVDEQDEIEFFKNIKPKVYAKLLYYAKIFSIETKRPNSRNKVQRKFLITEEDKIAAFQNDNLEFYQYYRCNTTNLDDRFFVRGKADIRLCIGSLHFLIDPNFSTSHDHIVSVIKAYDMLSVYLKTEIDKLDSKCGGNENKEKEDENLYGSKLLWTESKVALTELIYAIHSTGAINKGTTDINELAKALGELFNIDLGDPYRTFIEIRLRKKERTKFIDYLKNRLLVRMDEADQKEP
jgi:hypothetical protein